MIESDSLEQLFKEYFNVKSENILPISSHGSERQIFRLISKNHSSIGIINKNIAENKAFIEFGRHFKTQSLNVPEIYGVSKDSICYLTEDLGDVSLFSLIDNNPDFTESIKLQYKTALDMLLKFQTTAGKDINYSYCYQFNVFGNENIDFDIAYFEESFLKIFYPSFDAERLKRTFQTLKLKLLEEPADFFLYRDFQSRNIMIKNDELYFIDFQSGRRGALQYDLASLLFDAKADLPHAVKEEMLEYYTLKALYYVKIEPELFQNNFWYFAIIRILQAMGAYGYLGIAKGKKRFLQSIPYALNNLEYILTEKISDNEFEPLLSIISELRENKPIYEKY